MKDLRILFVAALSCALVLAGLRVSAADTDTEEHPLAGIPLRHIGPAINSGRIADFAFHPSRKQEFYVATASGNLWKTSNNTITWQAIFDKEGSYAGKPPRRLIVSLLNSGDDYSLQTPEICELHHRTLECQEWMFHHIGQGSMLSPLFFLPLGPS